MEVHEQTELTGETSDLSRAESLKKEPKKTWFSGNNARLVMKPLIGLGAIGLAYFGGPKLMPGEHESVGDIETSAWAQEIDAKLMDPSLLTSQEHHANEFIVNQSSDRDASGTINVRDYPAIEHSGQESRIIGTIREGTKVFNVILTGDRSQGITNMGEGKYVATQCGNIHGEIFNQDGSPIQLDKEKVCAISIDPAATSNSTIIK